jgi:hypothetical protein
MEPASGSGSVKGSRADGRRANGREREVVDQVLPRSNHEAERAVRRLLAWSSRSLAHRAELLESVEQVLTAR